MIAGEAPELPDPGGEQRFRPAPVSALVMVEGRGKLDESLQKGFFRLAFAQPDFLPDLMGLEEFAGIEMREPALEYFVFA